MREKAIEATRLLNELMLDLMAGSRSIEIFELHVIASRMRPEVQLGLRRMALSHIFITLSKWLEFHGRYKTVIPEDMKDQCLVLKKEIEARGVREFRNKVAGHIYDDEKKRPLTLNETENHVAKILKGNRNSFLAWVNKVNAPYPTSVVSIVEAVRDRIEKDHTLTQGELYPQKEANA